MIFPKLTPWYFAQMRKEIVAWSTMPLIWNSAMLKLMLSMLKGGR